MYKQYLSLNNHQGLIYHTTKYTNYIYIYIYINCHRQIDSFVVSQVISLARYVRCFKLDRNPTNIKSTRYLTNGLSSISM